MCIGIWAQEPRKGAQGACKYMEVWWCHKGDKESPSVTRMCLHLCKYSFCGGESNQQVHKASGNTVLEQHFSNSGSQKCMHQNQLGV